MAERYHPDKNRDDPKNAETKFKEVQEAYEVAPPKIKPKKLLHTTC